MDDLIDPGRVAFDVDGVVADTMTLFVAMARNQYGMEGLRYEHITSYELAECLDIDPDTLKDIVVRLLDDDHTAALAPLPGAVDVLTEIGRQYGPLRFVTARPTLPPIDRWLRRQIPLPDGAIDAVATGAFEAKAEVLLSKGVEWFVEDRLETCHQLAERGITPIVFRQPWNRKEHPYSEVGNWGELRGMIGI